MLALKTDKQKVTRLAFSADGKYLAAGGSGWKAHLWDLTAKKLKAKALPAFKAPVEWLGFRPDGRLFALSQMGQYAAHNPANGAGTRMALQHWWVGCVAAEPDCSAFYGTGSQARRWAFDGQLREVWCHEVPDRLIFGRGGTVLTPEQTVVSALTNGSSRTWLHVRDAATGALRAEHRVTNSLVRDLTLLPDGTLAFVREQQYQGPSRNAVMLGTLGGKFEPLLIVKKQGDEDFFSLAPHPTGKWLAVGQSDGTVRTFDTNTWREAVAYQWPVGTVETLAFAPDGLKAAAGGADGRVVVWDVDL